MAAGPLARPTDAPPAAHAAAAIAEPGLPPLPPGADETAARLIAFAGRSRRFGT